MTPQAGDYPISSVVNNYDYVLATKISSVRAHFAQVPRDFFSSQPVKGLALSNPLAPRHFVPRVPERPGAESRALEEKAFAKMMTIQYTAGHDKPEFYPCMYCCLDYPVFFWIFRSRIQLDTGRVRDLNVGAQRRSKSSRLPAA